MDGADGATLTAASNSHYPSRVIAALPSVFTRSINGTTCTWPALSSYLLRPRISRRVYQSRCVGTSNMCVRKCKKCVIRLARYLLICLTLYQIFRLGPVFQQHCPTSWTRTTGLWCITGIITRKLKHRGTYMELFRIPHGSRVQIFSFGRQCSSHPKYLPL